MHFTRHTSAISLAGLGPVLGLLFFFSGSAHAALVVPLSGSVGPTSSSDLVIAAAYSLNGNVDPFDNSNDNLISFTVTWDIDISASATIPATASGVNAIADGGGLSIGGFTSYGGLSGDFNESGNTGEFVTAGGNVFSSRVFLVSEAGVTYNPALLATVTGSAPFALAWNSQIRAQLLNASGPATDLAGSYNGSASIEYTASTVPAPGAASLLAGGLFALIGLRRRR